MLVCKHNWFVIQFGVRRIRDVSDYTLLIGGYRSKWKRLVDALVPQNKNDCD